MKVPEALAGMVMGTDHAPVLTVEPSTLNEPLGGPSATVMSPVQSVIDETVADEPARPEVGWICIWGWVWA